MWVYLNQSDWCLYKKRRLEHKLDTYDVYTQGKGDLQTQQETSHLPARNYAC